MGAPGGQAAVLLRAAHAGPAAAVTLAAGLLAVGSDADLVRAVTVVVAVGAGQLSIGWSNDLLDAARDREVRRTDKPLATGEASATTVRTACRVALAVTVVASLACGPVAGVLHLVVVGAGWAYNLGLKSTAWSWSPYAVAFGVLPVFVHVAGDPHSLPPWWVPVAGALIGVGAHLVNVLPDLADDAATGVRGLPHRLGARWTSLLAVGVLAAATLVVVGGAGDLPLVVRLGGVVVVVAALVVALGSSGRNAFRAAVVVALVDVVLLVAAGR